MLILLSYCLYPVAQSFPELFDNLNQNAKQKSLPKERAVMTIDRDLFLCGEDIVFNAYMYDANWFLPLSLSSILYVELYNQDNAVISNGKYLITNGKCSGSLPVPRTVISDNYYLRAYTNYMKNFGMQNFYLRKLKIINPFYDLSIYSAANPLPDVINCKTHPEAGILITGIKSQLVCRVSNSQNKGLQVNARVVDSDSTVITDFTTSENGFANFDLTPEKNKLYFIEITGENYHSVFPVQKPLHSGTTFSTDITDDNSLKVTILSNNLNDFPVTFYAKRGEFIYQLNESPINSPGEYYFPSRNIPKGLIVLELTDSKGSTTSGKILFQKSVENLQLKLNTNKEKYSARENIKVEISASDNKGKPVKTELSLFSVLSSGTFDNPDLNFVELEILRQDLMQIYPDYDMIKNVVKNEKLRELLLLSTSFTEAGMFVSNELEITDLPEINEDIITGKLTYKNNRPATGIEVLQSFVGKTTWIESSITDENGRFYFLNSKFENKGDIIFKVRNPEEEVFIFLEDEFFPDFPVHVKENLILTNEEKELISKQFINIQIDDAFSVNEDIRQSENDQETISFYGKEYKEYIFKDYFNLPNMREFIHDVVLGVTLSKTNRMDMINILEEKTMRKIGPNPLLVIDGVPIDDVSQIIELSPEDIKYVRVVRYKFFYKTQIFDGIMDIITYSNDATAFQLPENTFRFRFTPVTFSENSFSGENTESEKNRIPVYKNLLYSNPGIVTKDDGKCTFSFIAPDNSGKYVIKCFGRTQEGVAGETDSFIIVGK